MRRRVASRWLRGRVVAASRSRAWTQRNVATQAQREHFHENGWLVLPDVVSPQVCDQLMEHMNALCANYQPGSEEPSLFSTTTQSKESMDPYFLDSGDRTSFFYEADALDQEGKLVVPLHRAFNKVGHALHVSDPTFRAFSCQALWQRLASDLGGLQQAVPVQSMYIFKHPSVGGLVSPHTDNTFLATEPTSCIGLWFALQDATQDNACLWAAPGSHRTPTRARFRRYLDRPATYFDPEVDVGRDLPSEHAYVPLEVKAGSLVVLHGDLAHQSHANLSQRSRHAYTLHWIDATCHWPEDNWLQTRSGSFHTAEALRAME